MSGSHSHMCMSSNLVFMGPLQLQTEYPDAYKFPVDAVIVPRTCKGVRRMVRFRDSGTLIYAYNKCFDEHVKICHMHTIDNVYKISSDLCQDS